MNIIAEYDAERNVTICTTLYFKDGEQLTATVELDGKCNNFQPAELLLQDIIEG